jgi:hypothetical protein
MSRRHSSKYRAPASALEPLVETLIDLFFESVDSHCHNASGPRRTLALALLAFEGVSRTTRRLLTTNPRLPFYLFYYWSVAGESRPRRFLDGTFGVVLFDGSFGDGPQAPERLRALGASEVVSDRLVTASKLDAIAVEAARVRCGRYVPRDMPPRVSARVAAFVGRARLLCQTVAAHRPTLCVPCEASGCGRTMLDLNYGAPALRSDTESDSDDDDAPPSYWQSLLVRPMAQLPVCRLCSRACALDHEARVRLAVPVTLNDLMLQCDVPAHRSGLPRVGIELRLAFQRNAAVARALRTAARAIGSTPGADGPLTPERVKRLHADIVQTLNVDTALLVAAAAVAESPPAAIGRRLAATHAEWRKETWSASVRKVHAIMARAAYSADRDGIAADPRTPPTWLQRCREQALDIFPSACTA